VANHTGWSHIWARTNPEYYILDQDENFCTASGMEDVIELNYKNPNMRNAMIEAMKFWVLETDIDGFRCDLASWVEIDFWREAKEKIKKTNPLFWLGEFDELENPEFGKIFDASYSWAWMHKTEDFSQGNLPLSELKNLLTKYSEIGDSSMRIWFTTNHDENSWNGTEYEKYGIFAKLLAVFSATWNGIPLIYSGQELPNTKRLKFFEKDTIEWSGNYGLADFYKILFNLKIRNPALRGGDLGAKTIFLTTSADDKILAYLRKKEDNEVLIILNMSRDLVIFSIEDNNVSGIFRNIFQGNFHDFSLDKNFVMNPGEYAVFEKN
jgi:glycosidase